MAKFPERFNLFEAECIPMFGDGDAEQKPNFIVRFLSIFLATDVGFTPVASMGKVALTLQTHFS